MTLQSIQDDLTAARAGTLAMPAFSQRLRAQQVPESLPAKYAEVLADLADRIESSALFSGDSCSFSSADLLDAVQAWLDKASSLTR